MFINSPFLYYILHSTHTQIYTVKVREVRTG